MLVNVTFQYNLFEDIGQYSNEKNLPIWIVNVHVKKFISIGKSSKSHLMHIFKGSIYDSFENILARSRIVASTDLYDWKVLITPHGIQCKWTIKRRSVWDRGVEAPFSLRTPCGFNFAFYKNSYRALHNGETFKYKANPPLYHRFIVKYCQYAINSVPRLTVSFIGCNIVIVAH